MIPVIINEKVNVKGYYRFVKYISALSGIRLPHERLKRIVFDEFKAETDDEITVKFISEAYLYLINNINQTLTKDVLGRAYYLLTNSHIEEAAASAMLKAIYTYNSETPYMAAAKIHFHILKHSKEMNTAFAYMISNYVLMKHGRGPSIPSSSVRSSYKRAVTEGNTDKLAFIFLQTEQPMCEAIPRNKHTQEDVLRILRQSGEEIRSIYRVEKMFLYGSYAKNSIHPFSDVDVLVIFEDQINDIERLQLVDDIKKHFRDKYDLHIDLINFDYALEHMGVSEMEHIIKIF